MKTGIHVKCIVAVILALGIAMSCGDVSFAKAIKVKVHSQMPVGNVITQAMDLFIEEAEKLSRGRFKMQHFPAQQLLKSTRAPEMTAKGAVDIA